MNSNKILAIRRVLFINPPTGLYRRDDRCQSTVEDQTVRIIFPPMDLAMAAACAERAGAACRIEDYPAARRSWKDYINDLNEFQPDLLVLNAITATLDADLESCRLAREILPDILTAGKGETLIREAADILQRFENLDLILPNEPEEAIEEITRGHMPPEIRGLHFRQALLERMGLRATANCIAPQRKAQGSALALRREAEAEKMGEMQKDSAMGQKDSGDSANPMPPINPIVPIIPRNPINPSAAAASDTAHPPAPVILFTGKRSLQPSLDSLPLPARHLMDNSLYRAPDSGNPLTIIHGNRGCPSKCVFCPAGILTDYSVRHRSPANIVAELRQCVERYHIREFLFHGDTFTLNRRWLLELCQKIEESKLSIRWGCNSRVDTMDDERAAAMRRAGCWVVAFGVESGDEEMLGKMRKNTTLDQARESVEVCRRNGLRTHTFFVIGLPWETRETLERTYRFALELDPDFFDFNLATPLPGTELHNMAGRENLFESDYDPTRASYASGAIKTLSGISSAELAAWRRKKLLAMYMRPRYILRTLWRAGSPRIAANYARAALRRFAQLIRRRS